MRTWFRPRSNHHATFERVSGSIEDTIFRFSRVPPSFLSRVRQSADAVRDAARAAFSSVSYICARRALNEKKIRQIIVLVYERCIKPGLNDVYFPLLRTHFGSVVRTDGVFWLAKRIRFVGARAGAGGTARSRRGRARRDHDDGRTRYRALPADVRGPCDPAGRSRRSRSRRNSLYSKDNTCWSFESFLMTREGLWSSGMIVALGSERDGVQCEIATSLGNAARLHRAFDSRRAPFLSTMRYGGQRKHQD